MSLNGFWFAKENNVHYCVEAYLFKSQSLEQRETHGYRTNQLLFWKLTLPKFDISWLSSGISPYSLKSKRDYLRVRVYMIVLGIHETYYSRFIQVKSEIYTQMVQSLCNLA